MSSVAAFPLRPLTDPLTHQERAVFSDMFEVLNPLMSDPLEEPQEEKWRLRVNAAACEMERNVEFALTAGTPVEFVQHLRQAYDGLLEMREGLLHLQEQYSRTYPRRRFASLQRTVHAVGDILHQLSALGHAQTFGPAAAIVSSEAGVACSSHSE